jgi:soluble lytic murein transglycosylase-like protein
LHRRSQLGLLLAAALLLALPAAAGEHVTLTNGFQLYADRHELDGGMVRLYSGTSVTEFPASRVAGFQVEDRVVPPQPRPAPPVIPASTDPKDLVTEAAIRNGLEPQLLHSVAAAESGYRQRAISPKGAIGIMQLMPRTARELQADPTDARQNVDAGARYLRQLLLKYLDDPYQLRKALAAYNAGPAAVDRYGGIPPYPETEQYVRKVLQRRQAIMK